MKARIVNPALAERPVSTLPGLKRPKLHSRKKFHGWNYIFIGIAAAALIALCYFLFFAKSEFDSYTIPLSLSQVDNLLSSIYGKRSGYFLTPEEKNYIGDHGGECSYGEILFNTTHQLLFDIFKVKEGDVLHDFGSGVGKFVLQARLTSNVTKIIGTELSVTRSVLAREALGKIQNIGLLQPNDERLHLIEGSFLDLDISDATHIYMCSTCFHDELMSNIYKKILQEGKAGLQVVTLVMFNIPKKHKKLPRRLHFVATHVVPMSWSTSSPGYHYILEDNEVEEPELQMIE